MKFSRMTNVARASVLACQLSAASCLVMAPAVVLGAEVALADSKGRALVPPPEGLLRDNEKAKDAVSMLNWALMLSSAVPSTLFTIHAGKRFTDGEYGAAFGAAVGAVIAGLGGYLAFSFL